MRHQGNYQGNIQVLFSTDYGGNWTVIQVYTSTEFRSPQFFHIQIDIPILACTMSTRFKIEQPYFVAGK